MTGHSHAARDYDVTVTTTARTALLGFLGVAALAAVVGLWILWPHSDQAPHIPNSAAFAAPGVTFPHAKVTQVQPACPAHVASTSAASRCGHIAVQPDGAPAGDQPVDVNVPAEVTHSGLKPGDTVQLIRSPAANGQPVSYQYFGTERRMPLLLLASLFALLVVAVARLRGLLALVALGYSALIITRFMLPALLAGESGLGIALTGSCAIMFVVLYLTHGPSLRTSAALAGTLVGIGITAGIGVYSIHASRLSGVPDETGGFLSSFVTGLSFPGLLTCGLIIAGLGVLNDVTITQASAVWELRSAAPDLSRRQIFTSAMRIGRDHIASTIYTIVFAYTGASLIVLLLLNIYDRPLLDLLSTEGIAEELVRTLASGIGLVLAVPVTTAIAAAVASPAARGVGRHHGPLEPRVPPQPG